MCPKVLNFEKNKLQWIRKKTEWFRNLTIEQKAMIGILLIIKKDVFFYKICSAKTKGATSNKLVVMCVICNNIIIFHEYYLMNMTSEGKLGILFSKVNVE